MRLVNINSVSTFGKSMNGYNTTCCPKPRKSQDQSYRGATVNSTEDQRKALRNASRLLAVYFSKELGI